MNNGAFILLADAEGRMGGGEHDVNERGGIFGPQGYGGGVFDGAMALGAIDPCSDACEAKYGASSHTPDPLALSLCFAQCNLGGAMPGQVPPVPQVSPSQTTPGYWPAADCASLCALFLAFPMGSALAAACLDGCKTKTQTAGCYAPSVCKQMAALYPQELDPKLVEGYCSLPPQMQQVIDQACNALALQHPSLPPPPALPGQTQPEIPKDPGVLPEPGELPPPPGGGAPPEEAGIGLGTVAIIGGVAAVGLWFILKKR